MAVKSVSTFGVLVLLGMIVAGCASNETPVVSSAAPMGSSAAPAQSSAAPTKNSDPIAAGSVEDSLNACQARIPKDSSAGQRMLAEESCRRDQAARR